MSDILSVNLIISSQSCVLISLSKKGMKFKNAAEQEKEFHNLLLKANKLQKSNNKATDSELDFHTGTQLWWLTNPVHQKYFHMAATKAYFWCEVVWSGQQMEEKQWLRSLYLALTYCRPNSGETWTLNRTACILWGRMFEVAKTSYTRSYCLTFTAAHQPLHADQVSLCVYRDNHLTNMRPALSSRFPFGAHQWLTHVINDRPHFTLLAHQETVGTRRVSFLILVVSLTSDWAVGVIVGPGEEGRPPCSSCWFPYSPLLLMRASKQLP